MNLRVLERTNGQWTAEPGFGVYVHIPFCRHRCHYCDFNTYEGVDDLHGAYVDALIRQIESAEPASRAATSVFFGGGTPTLLAPKELGRILEAVDARYGLQTGAEITVEANPETVDVQAFRELRAAGFTRLSIGIQSLSEKVLRGLGRTHSAQVALDVLGAARAAGIANVNADLIFGSPWETDADWHGTLQELVAVRPAHISAYALTVEEGTPLATLVATGRVADIDPDVQAARYEVAEAVLEAAGYRRYEVSNWALEDRCSRHNVLYWCAGEYAGFGAGAHGHLAGRRYWNERLPRDFIAQLSAGRDAKAGEERLEGIDRAAEAMVLGLRLTSGVSRGGFAGRFGEPAWGELRRRLEPGAGAGLVELNSEAVRLTRRGVLFHSEVARGLL
ncbi:MAG: radical SAM family heme chaperone HemW [Actinomycetota bacterium]|nr:radical SAM family heme chaperone HemW [Actinomycetota bacterium]